MKKSSKAMITGAAMAGLFTGVLAAHAGAAPYSGSSAGKSVQQTGKDTNSCSGKDGCGGKNNCNGKHDCTGKNACKGQGGCKTGSNTCKGKNSCKGKGGCNTNKPM